MISSIILNSIILALSFPMFPFDPPENIRKPLVFLSFQECQNGKKEHWENNCALDNL